MNLFYFLSFLGPGHGFLFLFTPATAGHDDLF